MKRITSLFSGIALATVLVTAPASAQSQKGLVNVNVSDIVLNEVISDINVGIGVGLNVAAEICGVAVGVLASQLGQTGVAQCDGPGDQVVTITRLVND